jgi:glycine betaine catabolism B
MKYETTLQKIINRTPNIVSYRFPRHQELQYKPGQFFTVTLKKDDQKLTHYFSFSSSPTEPDHIEFTKKLSDSQYSEALRAAKPGDWALIDGPYGQFTFEGEYPKIALLGGGIGITPFISMAINATDKALNSKIVLFYSCNTPKDIVFREEFEELTKRNSNFRTVFTISEASADWKGKVGRITSDLVKQELPDYSEYIYYACGPPPMVKAMQALVESLGLPKEKLKVENFAGYT